MCGCTMRSPRGVGWLDGAWRDGRPVIPWVCCERVATSMSVVSMRMVTRRLSEVGDTNVHDFIQLFQTCGGVETRSARPEQGWGRGRERVQCHCPRALEC